MTKRKEEPRVLIPRLAFGVLIAFLVACATPTTEIPTGNTTAAAATPVPTISDIPDVPRASRPSAPVCTFAAAQARVDPGKINDQTVVSLAQLLPQISPNPSGPNPSGPNPSGLNPAGLAWLPDTIQSLLYSSKALLNTYYYGFSTLDLNKLHKQTETKFRQGRPTNFGEYPLEAQDEVAIDKPMDEYIDSIQDGHTFYLPPSSYGGFTAVTGGSSAPTPAFGFRRLVNLRDAGILVLDVQADSPALNVGIRRGDILLELDGQTFTAKVDFTSTQIAYNRIFADAVAQNKAVLLKYRSKGTTIVASVKPVLLAVAAMPWGEVIKDSSGGRYFYLRISSFLAQGLANEIHALVARATTANVKGVIIDLRDNGGGSVVELIGALGAFSPANAKQTLEYIDGDDFTFKYEAGKVITSDACKQFMNSIPITNPSEWTGNVAILETKNSASASEYFAQLLKLGGKTTVIGEQTRGVGNTSTYIVPISSGRGLSITVGRARNSKGEYLSPSVTPDVPAADDLQELVNGNDLAINAAFQVLK
jgi:carboxyl-terminal processing protease